MAPPLTGWSNWRQAGKIAIARTSGFEADQRKASPDQRRDNLAYLSQTPIVKVPGPLRFGGDYEFFNGDVFADDETQHLDEQISAIVLPRVRNRKAPADE